MICLSANIDNLSRPPENRTPDCNRMKSNFTISLLNTLRRNALLSGLAFAAIATTLYAVYENESFVVSAPSGSSQVTGGGNTAGWFSNMAVGQNNNVNGGSGWGNSAAIGDTNTMSAAASSAAVGYNNSVTNHWSFCAGAGLIVPSQPGPNGGPYPAGKMPATVVGLYNDENHSKEFLFSVGIGDGSSSRANALTVYKDGSVVIDQAQGDISMGQFQ